MTLLEKLLGRIIGAATLLGGAALILMVVHVTAHVIAKSFFGSPLPGTVAIVANYYMVAIVFIPLAFAERRSEHIAVDLFAQLLPRRGGRILAAFGTVVSVLIFSALAWRALQEAQVKQRVGTFIIEQGIRIDTWPAYYLMPLGCALMLAALAFKLARYLRRGQDFDVDRKF